MAEINTTTMEIEQLTTQYLEVFGELPKLPIMVSYRIIADLMEDAIISKQPVSQSEINARVAEITDPIDLESAE